MSQISESERYFSAFRGNIIGQDQCFENPSGRRRILYADWAASGRAYRPIENFLQEQILPFFGNTHTETTVTGTMMTEAYRHARRIIKKHVHAGPEDRLLFCGSGMTAAVCKLQRMMGLRWPEGSRLPAAEERPLVLVSHMEHHSNHISWLETIATVEVIGQDTDGNIDLGHLRTLLDQYRHRRIKVAAVTACSNVTGITTPVREVAQIMHASGGLCFVDLSCSAPYSEIDMHPGADADLDAIYFSMHKFLGGPGTPGVLVFHCKLYANKVPDHPGGGTLLYSNPWRGRDYVDEIEVREDGGTPPVLQAIKAGCCIRLKEEMGVQPMLAREGELVRLLLDRLAGIAGLNILAATQRKRLGVVSFVVPGAHYDDVVRKLNDRFGIQARGGCSCAGTYGHFLLRIDKERSAAIRDTLMSGDLRNKPGWIRLSLHPTMTAAEVNFIADAVGEVAAGFAGLPEPRFSCSDGRF